MRKSKKYNDYSCKIFFDIMHKKETLLLNICNKEYKIENIIGFTIVCLLNNLDKIINYLNNYISTLQRHTLSTIEIPNYNMSFLPTLPISPDKFSLLYILYLNFKSERDEDDAFCAELYSYIKTIANVYPDTANIWKTTSVLSFPNMAINNLLIESCREAKTNLISFEEKVIEYFKSNDLSNDTLPITTKQHDKYYSKVDECQILSLNWLLDTSLYYINLCEYAIIKNSNNTYKIIDAFSKIPIDLKKETEEIVYFSEVSNKVNSIKCYLKRNLKDLAESNRRQKALKKFDADLNDKEEFLKRKYKKNYKSDECQKILLNWIDTYIKENNIYSSSSNKKIGNTNAKKK